ncbi:hypothetical protein KIN20_017769 [Parelaphostrongylus tenuis]|uniref:Uncharacterized protein n=1 Tax=Parelaphostrongylus tenuis TaxID=148309 RepID=A0AAD5MLZ6_PARTN|nr:hypothetical protein KIN20_017769 [Parelaphostrongylus tenuis]
MMKNSGLDGSLITETSSNVNLDRPLDMENNMKEELRRRKRAAWTKQTIEWTSLEFTRPREPSTYKLDECVRQKHYSAVFISYLGRLRREWKQRTVLKSVVFQAASVYTVVKCCKKSGEIINRLWKCRPGHLVYFGKHSGNLSPNSGALDAQSDFGNSGSASGAS